MKTVIKYPMLVLFLLVVSAIQSQEIKENLASYINPFIGTTNGGNTNPGAYLKMNSPTEIVGHKMIGNFCE